MCRGWSLELWSFRNSFTSLLQSFANVVIHPSWLKYWIFSHPPLHPVCAVTITNARDPPPFKFIQFILFHLTCPLAQCLNSHQSHWTFLRPSLPQNFFSVHVSPPVTPSSVAINHSIRFHYQVWSFSPASHECKLLQLREELLSGWGSSQPGSPHLVGAGACGKASREAQLDSLQVCRKWQCEMCWVYTS